VIDRGECADRHSRAAPETRRLFRSSDRASDVPLLIRGEPDLPSAVTTEPVRPRSAVAANILEDVRSSGRPPELVRLLSVTHSEGIGPTADRSAGIACGRNSNSRIDTVPQQSRRRECDPSIDPSYARCGTKRRPNPIPSERMFNALWPRDGALLFRAPWSAPAETPMTGSLRRRAGPLT